MRVAHLATLTLNKPIQPNNFKIPCRGCRPTNEKHKRPGFVRQFNMFAQAILRQYLTQKRR